MLTHISLKAYRLLVSAIVLVTLCSCQSIPDGVSTVSDLELDRYAGTWYEIKRLDNGFEKHLNQVTATYNLKEDGSIQVINKGYDTVKNKWNEIEGKARVRDADTPGALEVSFFGPFYSGYNIIALDTVDYQYALVCGADRNYLWMLCRKPSMPDSVVKSFESTANELGFDTGEMVVVSHDSKQ